MAGGARCAAGSGWGAQCDSIGGPSAVEEPGAGCESVQSFFLSLRQTEVLRLTAAGCTEREVGLRLGVAPATVRGHLARVRARLGARSTAQAVGLAVALGLIEVTVHGVATRCNTKKGA